MTDFSQPQTDSRLRGNWLTLVRIAWVVVALAALGIFVFSLPGYLRPLGESRPIQASPEFIAVFEGMNVLISLAAAVMSLALAGLLFWRKPDDKMALFLSFFFLGYAIVMAGPLERLRVAFPNLALNAELAQPVVMTAPFVALFALFPNGRFVPGWMRWVTLGSLGFIALYFLAPCCDYSEVSPWLSGLITLSGLTVLALVIYAQIYRYRRVSSPIERQQTKWVVYGLGLFLVWVIVVSVPYAISQSLPADVPLPWWTLLASAGWWLSLMIMPLSLALSILRYRLFEIDIIIKRTVQYTLLSGAGFIIYWLAVGSTSLFLQSNIELVAGIIAIALVIIFFNPARKRLQALVDKMMPYTPPPPEVLAELEAQKRAPASTPSLANWLMVARVVWLVVLAAAIVNMLLDVPYAYNAIATLSDDGRPVGWSRENMQASLAGLGLPPTAIAVWQIVIAGLMSVAFWGVAVLIMWRRPRDRMALFVGFFFAAMGGVPLVNVSATPILQPNPNTYLLRAGLGWLAWTSLLAYLFVFPNGRFVPRKLWPVMAGWAGMALFWNFFADTPLHPLNWPNWLYTSAMIVAWGSAFAAQIYRYRFVSTPLERQQLKWVLYLAGVSIVGIVIPVVVSDAFVRGLSAPGPQVLGFILLSNSLHYLVLISVPVALAFILLRHRLWDIDIVVKRTVQYALISGAGFIIYLLAIGGTSLFLQSNIELVAGLIAVALVVVFFNPARKRLQAVMDKLIPYTPPPPEVLAELEAQKAEREKKKMDAEGARLPRAWLTAARIGWLAFFVFTVLVFLFAIPARWAQLTQPAPVTLANLNALGWPVMGYAVYALATELIFTAVFLAVGLFIFARRSDDGMALFMSLTLVAYGVGNQTITPTITALLQYPLGKLIYPFLPFAAWATFTQFPFLFPNGRFVPRWARYPALFWFLICIPWNFLPPDSLYGVFNWPPVIFAPLMLFLWGSWVVCQLYRYMRVSTPIERQQTKWVIYALVMIVVVLMGMFLGVFLSGNFEVFSYLAAGEPPTPPAFLFITVIQAAARLAMLFLPLAFAFSIFRYRLYDIDIVIKRTVQYGLISGAGFAVYLLAVGGTSLFLQQRNDLVAGVIVLALLVVFFNPARQRLQTVLDRLMPYTPPPPEVLAEIETQKAEREKKRTEKEAQKQPALEGTRLRGGWLSLARGLWIVLSLAAAAVFIAGTVVAWGEPLPNCATPGAVCDPWQVSQEDVAVARQLGLSELIIRLAMFVPNILAKLSFLAVGLLIFWRKPDDWVALLLSLLLTLWTVEGIQNLGAWMPVVNVLYLLDNAIFTVLPFIFPNGRFVPRWTRWVAVLTIILVLPLVFLPTLGLASDERSYALALLLPFVVWIPTAAYAVIYRHRRVSNAIERQQTKWVMTGLLSTFVIIIPVVGVATLFPPSQPSPGRLAFVTLVVFSISALTYFAVSGSIAFAIFRYRLYDIDIVIKRTVQYTLISGAGFAVYLLAVGGTSLFLQQRNDLIAGVIALALLVVFFNPARKRLQTVLDRVMPYTPPPPEVLAELNQQRISVAASRVTDDAPSSATSVTQSVANWLMAARIGWLAFFAFATLALLFAIPARWTQLTQLSPTMLANLSALGWPVEPYAIYSLTTEVIFIAVFLIVGLFIFARRSDDRMALLTALALVAFGVGAQTVAPTIAALRPHPVGGLVVAGLAGAVFITLPQLLYLFPNGRYVPKWTRVPALIWFVLAINISLGSPLYSINPIPVPVVLMIVLLWGTVLVSQIYRYVRVSNPIERQQTKWVMYAVVVMVTGSIIGILIMTSYDMRALSYLAVGEPPTPQILVLIMVIQSLLRLLWLLLPLGFAFSIMRYRLWDIDIVIKRTVQYALISSGGFVVYLLAVGGTSLFLQQRNDLVAGVIALALLVIFFNPARKRLQTVLDRVMPYTPPPPEVLAELEIQKTEREKRQMEKEAQPQTTADGTRLQGGWLTVARVVWVVSAILSLGMLLYSLPSGYILLNTVCVNEACEWGQLTPAGAQMLAGLGLSVTAYTLFFSSLITLMNLSYMVIGWFIFWRKSADRAALFISWAMVLTGTVDSGVVTFQLLYPTLFAPLALFRGVGYTCFFVLFIIFPNGQFVPRWSRWLILPVLAGQALAFLLIQTAPEMNSIFSAVWLTFGLGAQFYRYLRVSGPVERQQTKWVLVGFAATIVPFLVWPALAYVFPNIFSPFVNGVVMTTIGDMIWWAMMLFGALLLPFGLAFSMFRYRLWEVDLVIRRTVQYAVISALGFGVYLLAVGGTSLFLQARNDLLAGGLALGAAVAAFVWLRPRMEAWMNKAMPLPVRPPETMPVVSVPEAGLQSASIMNRSLPIFWQRLVRIGWVALALNSLWVMGWTLFYTWELAHTPPPRIAEGLAALNLSPDIYFWMNAIPIVLMSLSYFVVAAVLFWRRPSDRLALFVAVFLMAFGVANAYPAALEYLRVWETGGLHYVIPFAIANFLSWPLMVAFFALYPDGVFVPSWMRYLSVYGFLFSAAWAALPQAFGDPQGLLALFVYASICVIFGGSLYAQVHRYRKHATPLQRQQIKWMVFSIAMVTLAIVAQVVTALLQPAPTPAQSVQREFIFMPLTIAYVLLPIAVGLAIMRYRLFEVEIIVRRTVIYGAIVGGLGVAYFGGVALLQWLSQALTGPQSNFIVVLITLGIVALFNPVRRRFQIFIDRAFYREKVDFRQAFTAFAREVRTIIDLQELLRALVNRTTELLHITHGAVYLSEAASSDGTEETNKIERTFKAAEGKNLPEGTEVLSLGTEMLERLRDGHTISRPGHPVFPLLVSLIAPVTQSPNRPFTQSLIGVLALGPRLSDQAYSQEDQTLLTGLADQAGTALYVAQLIQEKQAEAQRIEEAERRLESYANSPTGRAERFANALISDGQSALTELHALTQRASADPAAAAMLEPLPATLTALQAPTLAGLADGYRYIFASQATPEVLPVGLRTLTDHLTQLDAPEALELYRLCQTALETNSISAIAEQGLVISSYPLSKTPEVDQKGPTTHYLESLLNGLRELIPAADALRAYERVDSPQDKLAYLASAVERLTHADRAAQAELGAADRPIVQRIAANWLTVVTGAMSELQTRARLVCRLLTRHTWTGEVIAVALAIRNEGRGAALNLKVALAPAPDYTLVDESVTIERLAAGEEAQAELRVRPHIGDKTGTTGGQFRARFILVYADPRGPDQTENFADVVYLLALEGEFKFIPNPYVVGTPLQTGSALFCGREDVFEFIQENLVAAHQNNLVLIGQRRTGKTSLLKQLPARLGEKYVSVYLDGQSLALDPGLPNFFYSLATEIAFTLEDRGLAIGDLPDFNDSPATTFERKFLARVREALGDRHLLLLLDEFEELESAVRRGNLDSSVFGFLRHLIQHSENLSVIFCGTHRMEELAADYWSVLFNISLYRHVAFLQQPEAFKLIQEPVSGFGMKYDDLALDKMWRVTAGHPYFLQLLCHSLVNQHNKSKRNYVTVADVNAALDEILASGEAHFIFLWTESTHAERLALTALSRMMPLTGQANPVQVSDYLAERGVPLDRRAVSEALHHLALRDILNRTAKDGAEGEAYRWQLGLLGLWVEKYKSLSRVVDEVRT